MGNKINPYGLRLGIINGWKSRWIADKEEYAEYLHEDDQIRDYIRERVRHAGISRIEITRTRDKIEINVEAARPGIVIGRRGTEADAIRDALQEMTGKACRLNIVEVKTTDLDAQVVAFNIAEQLRGRVSFRRAMRRAVQSAMKAGAKGIRVQVKGRLGGREMTRTEWQHEGRVPLHTLRARVDYGFDEARTTFGRIGCKVWIYTGDVLGSGEEAEAARAMDRARAMAEGRPVEDRTRRSKSARKAASVARQVAGVGQDDDEDEQQPAGAEKVQTERQTVEEAAQTAGGTEETAGGTEETAGGTEEAAGGPEETAGDADEAAGDEPTGDEDTDLPAAGEPGEPEAAVQQSDTGGEAPDAATETGESPKTEVADATTEQAPPQSGPMDVEEVADVDVEDVDHEKTDEQAPTAAAEPEGAGQPDEDVETKPDRAERAEDEAGSADGAAASDDDGEDA